MLCYVIGLATWRMKVKTESNCLNFKVIVIFEFGDGRGIQVARTGDGWRGDHCLRSGVRWCGDTVPV